MNNFNNLGYDRWLQCKQPYQESGLSCFSFTRYSQKCVTQIYRALYGDAMFVSFVGTQTWWLWCNKNICRRVFTPELWHIEIIASSSARTVWFVKTNAIAHLWPTWQPFLAAISWSCHATKKLGNLNELYNKTKNPVKLKHCQTSSSYRVFYLT